MNNMSEFIRRNFIRGCIILIGLYLLIVTSLLCKDNTSIKDGIIGREYENKQLVKQIELLNKSQDSLNNIINRQNSDIAEYYLQDEALIKEIKILKSKNLNKEYEKANKFTNNFTSDSISRYFSNL
jgi:hypothetical protein